MVEKTLTPDAEANGGVETRDPFAMLQKLQHETEYLWHRPFLSGAGRWPTLFPPVKAGWMNYSPRTDVYEKGNVLVFKVEMPGIAKEDVSVELDEGDLVIKGTAGTFHADRLPRKPHTS